MSSSDSPSLDPSQYPEAVCDTWWLTDDATPTLKDFVLKTDDLSTLTAALGAVNMTDLLRYAGPILLFAPTNEAFESLVATYGVAAEDLLAEQDLLARLIQYHVIVDGATCETAGPIENGTSALGGLPQSIATGLPGEFLTINASNNTIRGSSGNLADVIGVWVAGNGVAFVIDNVLLPTEDGLARKLSSSFSSVDSNGDEGVSEPV